jgi:3'(2'), 5'-bisphosphate nucleotidase
MEELFEAIDLGGSGKGGHEGRIWMLDPIDGTAKFLRGEQYAVSLALVKDGREVVGVIGCPNLSLKTGRVEETSVDAEGMGFMLSAVRGEGAVIRPMGKGGLRPAQRIERSVDGPKDIKDLHFVDYTTSETYATEKVRRVAATLGAVFPWTEIWSSHMRYVSLIVGDGDVQVRIPVKKNSAFYVWDHAGTQLIYTEIGGKITDLEGNDIEFGMGRQLSSNWGLVAAKEGVHARILQVVKDVLQEA